MKNITLTAFLFIFSIIGGISLPAQDDWANLKRFAENNKQIGMQPAEKVVQLNAWIKKYADVNGCVYLDYFTSMADEKNALKAEYTYDGVHPNLAGYKIMEPLVESAIRKALGLQ